MSYGKDPSQLNNIPGYGGSFSQRAGNASRRRQKTSSDNNRPFWADTFKPQEMIPIWGRLIPVECKITRADDNNNLYSEPTQWYEYREHFHGRHKRSAICSAGPLHFLKNHRDPCLGCDIFWSTPKAGKGERKIISRSDKYAFVFIDMSNYHKVPQVDDATGQYRMNTETNQPYLHWVRCAGYGCQACHTAYETRAGYIQPWTMSKAHFNALNAYADGISTCCLSCNGRGSITPISYTCAGCNGMIIDTRNTTANQNQVRELVSQHYHCRTCNTVAYPVEILQCRSCQSPRRASIFDVDINVMVTRTGDGDQTALILQNTTDPKPLDPQFHDLLQYTPDLMKRFAPSTLEYQAEQFQVAIGQGQAQQPVTHPQPVVYAQPYGQAPAPAPMQVQPQQYQPVPQQAPQQALQPRPQWVPPQQQAPAMAPAPQQWGQPAPAGSGAPSAPQWQPTPFNPNQFIPQNGGPAVTPAQPQQAQVPQAPVFPYQPQR